MGGPAADFGGVFKAHIWQQPAHRLAQPPELDTMSKFHFGQAPPPVINHLCVIAHSLLAPVCGPHLGIVQLEKYQSCFRTKADGRMTLGQM